jgi:XTP/dITP diphosphohydrolase
MTSLLVATRNPHKTREIRQILGDDFALQDLSAYPDVPEIAETGETLEENASIKVLAAASRCAGLVTADDSGLEVDALEGAPGIFSARYAGDNATDQQNIEKLLRELSAKGGAQSARFRCVVALAEDGRLVRTFAGAVEGKIIDRPRGKGGFGYDPLFVPKGFSQTFAELSAAIKNRISHRAEALRRLIEFLSGRDVSPPARRRGRRP